MSYYWNKIKKTVEPKLKFQIKPSLERVTPAQDEWISLEMRIMHVRLKHKISIHQNNYHYTFQNEQVVIERTGLTIGTKRATILDLWIKRNRIKWGIVVSLPPIWRITAFMALPMKSHPNLTIWSSTKPLL